MIVNGKPQRHVRSDYAIVRSTGAQCYVVNVKTASICERPCNLVDTIASKAGLVFFPEVYEFSFSTTMNGADLAQGRFIYPLQLLPKHVGKWIAVAELDTFENYPESRIREFETMLDAADDMMRRVRASEAGLVLAGDQTRQMGRQPQ